MNPFLIGQAPGKNTDPWAPLHASSATGRAFIRHGELTLDEYNNKFDKTNVLNFYPGKHPSQKGDQFDLGIAAPAAARLKLSLPGRKVLLCGRNVELAFRYRKGTWFQWRQDHEHGFSYSVIPHASGCNPLYNDPWFRQNLRMIFESLLRSQDVGASTECLPPMVCPASMAA